MEPCELSIIIPSRNEIFLRETIEDILKNIEADTEIIAVCDESFPNPPIPQHERVNIFYSKTPVGQRGGANIGWRLARGRYVMKVDAHCSFDKGFDRKMIKGFKGREDAMIVPVMRNLWAFDWKCKECEWKKYQGPTPEKCPNCGGKVYKDMKWIGKERPQSVSYCFDTEPHFQYFNEWKKTDTYKKQRKTGFTETMSLQGSCFMCTKKLYSELNLCDEKAGSWGNQGVELACKAWLSGHRVLVNHNTWYAHMFRTQGGDFGFPYPNKGKDVVKTKQYIKDLFWNNKYKKQIKPLSWLVKKFMPVKGWKEEDLNKLK